MIARLKARKAGGGPPGRLTVLRRFAMGITTINVLGFTVLGFEPAPIQVLIAIAAAYGTELVLETVDAWSKGRRPRYLGGVGVLVDHLLPAHIAAMSIGMLLYPIEQFWVVAFASVVAIGLKWILRAPVDGTERHFLNPSNSAIAITLLVFPWTNVIAPWQFTQNLDGAWDWIVPGILLALGLLVVTPSAGRRLVALAWIGGFVLQAVGRSLFFGIPLMPELAMMTGAVFMLFSCFMLPDPATTPSRPGAQVVFGLGVALVYGLLVVAHVGLALFFALLAVTMLRGIMLHVQAWAAAYRPAVSSEAVPALSEVAPGYPQASTRA